MDKYPIVHVIVLIIGGIILFVLKKKYTHIRYRELIIIFILMVMLIAIFTDTGIDVIKKIVSLIQLD